MSREELTAIIRQYAVEYADYKLERLGNIAAKPPVNPVNKILSELNSLEHQVAYWKLSFNKQVKASNARNI